MVLNAVWNNNDRVILAKEHMVAVSPGVNQFFVQPSKWILLTE